MNPWLTVVGMGDDGPDGLTPAARAVIEQVGASGPGDRGKVMGMLMKELRGEADGSLVNAVVGELLAESAEPD